MEKLNTLTKAATYTAKSMQFAKRNIAANKRGDSIVSWGDKGFQRLARSAEKTLRFLRPGQSRYAKREAVQNRLRLSPAIEHDPRI